MRRIIFATAAALAVLAAGTLAPTRAEAMTLATPAAIQAAIDDTSLAQTVAYVCRRVWRCGYYGCGWRRSCSYTRPAYRWQPQPYYRHHHRHHYRQYRHYRRHW